MILLRVLGFPLIRIPLRADDQSAWAEARDLPPSYTLRSALVTPDQPLAHTDDPDSAFENLLESLNLAMISGNMAYYTGYSRMPKLHRDLFIRTVRAAQASRDADGEKQGIWKLDPGWNQPLTLLDEGSIGPDSGWLIWRGSCWSGETSGVRADHTSPRRCPRSGTSQR